MKPRLSQNQKDTLFILALLETKQVAGPIPTAKIKAMIDQSRAVAIDPSNFRKGLHTLASRGLVELPRAHDLSLAISLTRLGRHDAARIYCERTGTELDVPVQDDEQITIFDALDVVETSAIAAASIEGQIKSAMGECCDDEYDEALYKFNYVVSETIEDHDLAMTTNEFGALLLVELLADAPCNFLNLRFIRNGIRKVLNDLASD